MARPTKFPVAMERKNVMLDVRTIREARKLARGNLSDGLREAVRLARPKVRGGGKPA